MINGKLLQVALAEYGVAEGQNLSANKYHFVNAGDTLFSISRTYNVLVSQIQQWNNLRDNTIIAGQSLRVASPAFKVISNSRILQYAADLGFNQVKSENDAWCSLFMMWCAWKAGLIHPNSLSARSWMKIGTIVQRIEDADIVGYWRDSPTSIYGHVGLPLAYSADKKFIHTFGGNQSDRVCVKPYPEERRLQFIKLDLAA